MCENDWNAPIGKIVATFGLKGEVKVIPYEDLAEYFEDLEEACIAGKAAAGRVLEVEGVRPHKGAFLIKFAGVDDIDAAEALRGSEVKIPESDLEPLGEDEYYIEDILGLDVVTTEGEHLGKVREVLRTPAHDVYVTDRAMIPAVKEFVVEIDLDAKKITVRAVEGLVEEKQ